MSRIHLKNAVATASSAQQLTLLIEDRLPRHVTHVGVVSCSYQLKQRDDYYLLQITTDAVVEVCCQRCLEPFEYLYHDQQTLACCRSEETANRLMNAYDCLVVPDGLVNLQDVVTDDIHLNVPEKHETTCEIPV